MIGIRKSLDFVFARRELKILDDVMPEVTKRSKEDEWKLQDNAVSWLFFSFLKIKDRFPLVDFLKILYLVLERRIKRG